MRTGAVLTALLLLASACGSQLTDAEIIARSGTQSAADGAPAPTATSGAGHQVSPDAGSPSATSLLPGVQGHADPTDRTGSEGPVVESGTGDPVSTGCSTTETGPIVLGNVGNYTGPAATTLGTWPEGVRIWAAAVNSRGGLCGRQVQVLVEDDGGDPARYASIVRNMVENQNVVAFVANAGVLSARGGIDYHNQSGVPVFGNDGSFPEEYVSPVIAPIWPTVEDVLPTMVRGSVELSGRSNFGYLFCNEAEVCHQIDELYRAGAVQRGGAQLVYRAGVSITQIDFTAECQSAQRAGVDLFTVVADAATVARIARSCARQNYFPRWILSGIGVTSTIMSEPGLGDAIVTSLVFPFAGGSGTAIDEFQQAVDTFAPQNPSGGLAVGWASGKLFELVATRAAQASQAITPQTLVAALHTVEGENLGGLTTALTFRADGTHHASCSFVFQGDGNGGYTTPLGSEARCL